MTTSNTHNAPALLKVYKASAGSGKTFRLVVEYIKLLILSPEAYANILAVTFTNKATSEMKSRIMSELYGISYGLSDSDGYLKIIQKELSQGEKKWSYDEIRKKAKEALSSILHNYSRFRIETIDSFFQSILKNLAKELGLGAYMNVELDNNSVLQEAVKELFNKVKEDKYLMQWISDYIDDKLNANKSWRLNSELESFGQNIFREDYQKMERQIAQNNPNSNLIKSKKDLVDYKKSLTKLKETLMDELVASAQRFRTLSEKNNLTTADFSYGKSGVANYFNTIIDKRSFPDIGKRATECQTDASKWATAKGSRRNEIIALAESDLMKILNETIEIQSKNVVEVNTINLISKDINKLGLLNDIAKIISETNKANNQFMLADTTTLLNEMIKESDAPFIYEKVGAYIKHIMIDEFQDTSLTQWENFKPLLLEGLSQNALSLIVGDPKQSIYRWRNSDWRTITNIDKELSSTSVDVIPMKDNWRSEANIIHFNNQLFESALSTISETMEGNNVNMQKAYSDVQQAHKKENEQGYVCVEFLEDEEYVESTLTQLVAHIETLQKQGISAEEITILVRKNKNIPLIAQFLSDYHLSHPESPYTYDVISDEAYQLGSSLAVQIIIQALQYISDPNNTIYKAQLEFSYRTEIKGEKDDVIANGFSSSQETDLEKRLKKAALLPLYEMVEEIYKTLELHKIPHQESYMYSFLDGLNDFLVKKSSDINQFLRHWEEKMKNTTLPFSSEIKGIKIMSIHKSKGLEFHTVIIPFCDWSLTHENGHEPLLWCNTDQKPYNELPLIPVSYKKEMKDSYFSAQYYEETEQLYVDNLNILYVALTRAQKNLIILGKKKGKKKDEKKEGESSLSTISDLIRQSINGDSHWDQETERFELGSICNPEKENKVSANILKRKPEAISFAYQSHQQKANFRQSNQSKDFIDDKESKESQFISKGKVLHKLFSMIKTEKDIESAADQLVFEGVVSNEEKNKYTAIIKKELEQGQAKEWFAPGLELFNECEIVYKEGDEIKFCRPDRVIKQGNEMTVIDYKIGKKIDHKIHEEDTMTPHEKNLDQVRKYISILQEMGFQAKGFVWYVAEKIIVEVK